MLMKFKDYKIMSKNEMRQIIGGDGGDPPEPPVSGFQGSCLFACCRWTGTQNCSSRKG